MSRRFPRRTFLSMTALSGVASTRWASWLEPLAGRPLAFRTTGQAQPLTLEPLNGIFDERYAVYWKVLERAV